MDSEKSGVRRVVDTPISRHHVSSAELRRAVIETIGPMLRRSGRRLAALVVSFVAGAGAGAGVASEPADRVEVEPQASKAEIRLILEWWDLWAEVHSIPPDQRPRLPPPP